MSDENPKRCPVCEGPMDHWQAVTVSEASIRKAVLMHLPPLGSDEEFDRVFDALTKALVEVMVNSSPATPDSQDAPLSPSEDAVLPAKS